MCPHWCPMHHEVTRSHSGKMRYVHDGAHLQNSSLAFISAYTYAFNTILHFTSKFPSSSVCLHSSIFFASSLRTLFVIQNIHHHYSGRLSPLIVFLASFLVGGNTPSFLVFIQAFFARISSPWHLCLRHHVVILFLPPVPAACPVITPVPFPRTSLPPIFSVHLNMVFLRVFGFLLISNPDVIFFLSASSRMLRSLPLLIFFARAPFPRAYTHSSCFTPSFMSS